MPIQKGQETKGRIKKIKSHQNHNIIFQDKPLKKVELPFNQDEENHVVAEQIGDRPKGTQDIVQAQNNEDISKDTLHLENTTDQLRRSRRIPKVSAKYLESIRSELQDSDTE